MEEINLLKENGVDPSAFVWVHAQAEKDIRFHKKAAAMKSWIVWMVLAGGIMNSMPIH
ncbi:MAG: hypothetical protein WDO71_21600 [Bacteroidota bacterium]